MKLETRKHLYDIRRAVDSRLPVPCHVVDKVSGDLSSRGIFLPVRITR